jgi:hypothetical protein
LLKRVVQLFVRIGDFYTCNEQLEPCRHASLPPHQCNTIRLTSPSSIDLANGDSSSGWP